MPLCLTLYRTNNDDEEVEEEDAIIKERESVDAVSNLCEERVSLDLNKTISSHTERERERVAFESQIRIRPPDGQAAIIDEHHQGLLSIWTSVITQ